MRKILLFGGIVAVLLGLVWMGQGSGYFPYPASSFMIDEIPWFYRGFALGIAGLIAIGVSRRV
jgi:hypothetical protein